MTATDDAHRPVLPPLPDAAVAPSGGVPVSRSRRTRLTIQRVDPWTVLRLSFALSCAVAVVSIVAMLLLWLLLSVGGVFGSVEASASDILGQGADTFTRYFSFGTVLWVAILLAVCDIVLLTALATVAALLFNLATGLTGGLEVTVTEDS